MQNEIKKIETFLNSYLEKNFKNNIPNNLYEAIHYSLYSGGKRIRPVLSIYAYNALCGDNTNFKEAEFETKVIAAASALECIHNYSLVHDDLPCMDNDIERRGKPTTHVKFGESIGLLAGDALLNLAYEILADFKLPSETIALIAKNAGSLGMIGGQVYDIDKLAVRDSVWTKQMQSLKTGALFRASILIPATVCEFKSESKEYLALDEFAKLFGLAFQIVDDIDDNEVPENKLDETIVQVENLISNAQKEISIFKNNSELNSVLEILKNKCGNKVAW